MEYNEYKENKCHGVEKLAYQVAKIRTLNDVVDVFRNQNGELYWKWRDLLDDDIISIDERRKNPEFIETLGYLGNIQLNNKRAMKEAVDTVKFSLYQAENYKETEYYQKKYLNK